MRHGVDPPAAAVASSGADVMCRTSNLKWEWKSRGGDLSTIGPRGMKLLLHGIHSLLKHRGQPNGLFIFRIRHQ